MTYAVVDYDRFTDPFGAPVSLIDGRELELRLGITAEYDKNWTRAGMDIRRLRAYGIANLHLGLDPETETSLAGVALQTRPERLWGSLGIGGTYGLGRWQICDLWRGEPAHRA